MSGWDPARTHAGITLSGTESKVATANDSTSPKASIGLPAVTASRKVYWEVYVTHRALGSQYNGFGICGSGSGANDWAGGTADSWAWAANAYRYHAGTQGAYVYPLAAGIWIGFALDKAAGKLFLKRGDVGWLNSANPETGANPHFEDADIATAAAIYPMLSLPNVTNAATLRTYAAEFAGPIPAGYEALEAPIFTALTDASLVLTAYRKDLVDWPVPMEAAWLAWSDLAPYLAAVADGGGLALPDLRVPLEASALVLGDLAAGLAALGRDLADLAVALSTRAGARASLRTILSAASPIVLRDLGLGLAATDGTGRQDLGVICRAVRQWPQLSSIIAQRLRAVVREVA